MVPEPTPTVSAPWHLPACQVQPKAVRDRAAARQCGVEHFRQAVKPGVVEHDEADPAVQTERPVSPTTRFGVAGGEWRGCWSYTARCLTPAAGARGRCTPRHRRPQRRVPRHDRAVGVIPSRRGWRPRPRRQRGQMPRAILVPVSGGAGPAASRGQGRRRGRLGHGPRSSSTPGRHRCRPRDATAASAPRRQRHRGRCAPTQAPAPHGPCADPRVRARRQASGSVSPTEPTRTVLLGTWRTSRHRRGAHRATHRPSWSRGL
jgi:hypothetical protein